MLSCPELTADALASGDEIQLDLAASSWRSTSRNDALPPLKPVSSVQREIMAAGGLFALRTG